jgi:ornithine carbamoyltransferase
MTDQRPVAAPGSLGGRDLVGAADLTPSEIRRVFDTAARLKAEFAARRGHNPLPLAGRTIAMLFERPSLRTRVTFEAGMAQLGGHAIALTPSAVGWGARESIADVAANLDNFVDGLVIRTGPHEIVTEFAVRAQIPVINALTLREHPCQALADVFTLREVHGATDGLIVAFVGDGNNVYHSLAIVAVGQGIEVRLAHPPGYGANPRLVEVAIERAAEGGGRLVFTSDPREAVSGADVIYTDAWTSMGQEAEAGERRTAFEPYRVDSTLVAAAGRDVRIMHCLPAHRGEEITAEVLDGPASIVLRQSENRLHVQKALLVELLGGAA